MKQAGFFVGILTTFLAASLGQPAFAQQTKLLWGDTHLHSNLSPDAYIQRNTSATPDDSFRFAKGAPVLDALTGAKIQLGTPLDFLVLTDHAEYAGIPKMIWQGNKQLMATKIGKRFAKMIKDGKGINIFVDVLNSMSFFYVIDF